MLLARAGQHGGYTLGRPAHAVSLLEVVEAVEGPLITRECVMRDGLCGEDGYCLLHDAWSTARQALRDVLARTSLASAVTPSEALTSQRTPLREKNFTLPATRSPNGAARVAAAGTYQVSCSVMGHREAGMTGTLIVE